MKAKQSAIALFLGLTLAVGVVETQAARNCKKLCRRVINENITETCSGYRGAIKRACKADVRQTIVNFCKRQEGGGCLGL